MEANPLEPYVPLSSREMDILRLLANGKSDREIADQLVVALTTVKWYNRQIFNKLGANGRREAVEAATGLGLVGDVNAEPIPKHNLPAQITPFIGRVQELNALPQLLITPQHRLVTLLAPGGMGKTRLALALAELLLDQFADGVFFVELAPVTSVDQIIPTIAEAVGFQFANDSRSLQQQMAAYFRRKRLLLILDNFEHLLDGAVIVSALLQAAADVSVLVTSRERLNLQGESVYPLAGLAYPDGKPQTDTYPAVELFLERAHRTAPTISDDHQQTVARICQMVQGMPLAIELAAAWAGSLSLTEIASEIQRSADFLRTTMRDVPERLRSVRTVFESTWRRLSANEQRVFKRLSVFHGGFTRDAAQAVAGASAVDLADLVDKALLTWHGGARRYSMHELLRQYASGELAATGESQAVIDAHCDYFGRFAREQGLALKTPQQLEALARLDADVDNVRAAFQRAIEIGTPEALDSFGELWFYYEIRGWWVEGETLFGAAVDKLEPTESVALARMLACYTVCLERIGRTGLWPITAQRSADMLSRFETERGNLLAFWYVGIAALNAGPDAYETALSIMLEVIHKAKAQDDLWSASLVMYLVGLVQARIGRYADAKITELEALGIYKQINNTWALAWPHYLLGDIANVELNFEEAEYHYGECLRYAHMTHNFYMISGALNGMAGMAIMKGDLDFAKHLAIDLLEQSNTHGLLVQSSDTLVLMAEIEIAAGKYDAAKLYLRDSILMLEMLPTNSFVHQCLLTTKLILQNDMIAQAVELLGVFKRYRDHVMISNDESDTLLDAARSALSIGVYEAAWAAGQTLTAEEVRARLLAYL